MMAWLYLVSAGIFEMLGVVMIHRLHQHRNAKSLVLLVVSFTLSFLLLALAMETLPMATSYAVWTGIGAAGGAILGMVLHGESTRPLRLLFIGMILASAIGLKLVS